MSTLESPHTLRVTGDVPQAVALAFLKGEPRENVYLISRIWQSGMTDTLDASHGSFLGAFDDDQSLRGLCFMGNGGTLVLSVDDPWVAGTFAEPLAERGFPFSLCVCENTASRVFLSAYKKVGGPKPLMDRRQPYYILDASSLAKRGVKELAVEQASLDSIDELTEMACAMVAEDFKLKNQAVNRSQYRSRMTDKVMGGRAFLSRDDDGRAVFKCDFAVLGPYGGLMEGVFTPKSDRKNGIATRAIWSLCRDLLGESEIPFIALHVDARNKAARRAYEKVGFQQAGDFRLILMPARHS